MTNFKTWTTADFDTMSWHDNHIHGMKIQAGNHGTGELHLDLDYILEWTLDKNSENCFHIAPAHLQFHEVTSLRVVLDYASPPAEIVHFSIDGIEREIIPRKNHETQIWKLPINWPTGEITFESLGFTQKLTGRIHVKFLQYLDMSEREVSNDQDMVPP